MPNEVAMMTGQSLLNNFGLGGAVIFCLFVGLFLIGKWFLSHLEAIMAQHKSERNEWRDFLKEMTKTFDDRQKETNMVIDNLANAIQSKLFQGSALPPNVRRRG